MRANPGHNSPNMMRDAQKYPRKMTVDRAEIPLKNRIRIFGVQNIQIFEYLCLLLYTVLHKAAPCVINYKLGNCYPI